MAFGRKIHANFRGKLGTGKRQAAPIRKSMEIIWTCLLVVFLFPLPCRVSFYFVQMPSCHTQETIETAPHLRSKPPICWFRWQRSLVNHLPLSHKIQLILIHSGHVSRGEKPKNRVSKALKRAQQK